MGAIVSESFHIGNCLPTPLFVLCNFLPTKKYERVVGLQTGIGPKNDSYKSSLMSKMSLIGATYREVDDDQGLGCFHPKLPKSPFLYCALCSSYFNMAPSL
jgi:hypothetical protein